MKKIFGKPIYYSRPLHFVVDWHSFYKRMNNQYEMSFFFREIICLSNLIKDRKANRQIDKGTILAI